MHGIIQVLAGNEHSTCTGVLVPKLRNKTESNSDGRVIKGGEASGRFSKKVECMHLA